MEVAIQPELQRFVEEQVKSGRFASSVEAMEAGLARLMLDAEPDVLDDQDIADIQQSLEQLRSGQGIDAKAVHANLLGRFPTK